jgi:hypothetical protein
MVLRCSRGAAGGGLVADVLSEHPAVLERHPRALGHVLQRGVRGVAEQGDPACSQFMIGSRSNIRHQRLRHMCGMPCCTWTQIAAKASSSSSGPQSFSRASALGDSKTATWLNISPPRRGYRTKWQRGPT